MTLMVRPLTAALRKKAEKEINENPRRVAADVTAMKEWLRKQPHLETVQPRDQWLVAFLRGGKFSIERSKEKLEMYYTLKTMVPEFFTNRDPRSDSIQEILNLGSFLPLKKCRDEEYPRVCIMRIGQFNPSKYHLSDLIKVALMVTEILMLEDDNFTVCGEEIVVDMKNVGLSILSQWTPALAKKVITCFEKALPLRMKGTHILNTPSGFETAYTIFKMFLSEKLKKRLQVYNRDYKTWFKAVPKTILPIEYGGEDGTLEELRGTCFAVGGLCYEIAHKIIDYWKAKVESYRDWFLDQENAKTDEAKRPGDPKSSSMLFGVEGSFRNLEVD